MRKIWEMCKKHSNAGAIAAWLYLILVIFLPYVLPNDIQNNSYVRTGVKFVSAFVPMIDGMGKHEEVLPTAQVLMVIYMMSSWVVFILIMRNAVSLIDLAEKRFQTYTQKKLIGSVFVCLAMLAFSVYTIFDRNFGNPDSTSYSLAKKFLCSKEKIGFIGGSFAIIPLYALYALYSPFAVYYRKIARKFRDSERVIWRGEKK